MLAYRGGSTVDAAVASLICLGMVNPHNSGIGGGFNAIIYDRTRNSTDKVFRSLNAREMTPRSLNPSYYEKNPSAKSSGPMSILIPGEVNGYYEAWKMHGRVSWKDLFQPTIRLGREGWNVTETMAICIQKALDAIRADPGLSELLLKPDGRPYTSGELMKNQKLADILEQIANDGPQVFYQGSIARDIVLDLQDMGAENFTADDLASHKAIFQDPLMAEMPSLGYEIYTTPPSSSGVLTALVLKLMDGYNYSSSDLKDEDSLVLFYHRLTEAWKIAFNESGNLGDIGFDSKVENWTSSMLNDKYINRWRSYIRDDRVLDLNSLSTSSLRAQDSSTSGLCIMTADGSGICATTTVGSLWGCKRRGKRTGIIFNNGMSLFSLPSSTTISANHLDRLKHARSSTSPLMIVDGKTQQIRTAHSASGGQRIVTSISFVASQIIWRGLSANEATDEPRLHHQGIPNIVYYDDSFNQTILEGLQKKGHLIQALSTTTIPYLGVAQTITAQGCSDCGERVELIGVSDYRKGSDSAPSGF